jgi:ribosomal protein L37E
MAAVATRREQKVAAQQGAASLEFGDRRSFVHVARKRLPGSSRSFNAGEKPTHCRGFERSKKMPPALETADDRAYSTARSAALGVRAGLAFKRRRHQWEAKAKR